MTCEEALTVKVGTIIMFNASAKVNLTNPEFKFVFNKVFIVEDIQKEKYGGGKYEIRFGIVYNNTLNFVHSDWFEVVTQLKDLSVLDTQSAADLLNI